MKKITVLIALLAALLFSSGCTSPQIQTFGPLVAQIAQARIAQAILDKNPEKEASLLAVADALDALSAHATGAEITEAAIRLFVAKGADKWQLLPAEQELLAAGLIAARDAFLSSTGQSAVLLNDPRAGPWINAIRQGIRSGVAAHGRTTVR